MQAQVTVETVDTILQKETKVKKKAHDNKRDIRQVHGKLEEGLSGSG
jgi:hypothetical protein